MNGRTDLTAQALLTALVFVVSVACVMVMRHYGVFTLPKLPASVGQ